MANERSIRLVGGPNNGERIVLREGVRWAKLIETAPLQAFGVCSEAPLKTEPLPFHTYVQSRQDQHLFFYFETDNDQRARRHGQP